MSKVWMILSFTVMTIVTANEKSDTIINDTTKEMLCIETYPSVNEVTVVDGRKHYKEIQKREENIRILKSKQYLKKKRKGRIVCFNKIMKITSYENNRIEKILGKSEHGKYATYIDINNKYDLTQYENKTRADIEKMGIAQRCAPYKNGMYCNFWFGLDVYFDTNKTDAKVKKVFFYDSTVDRGKLPFEPASMMKLKNNGYPLGLWVQKSYRKLFENRPPTLYTNSVMIWENLTPHIDQVIVTAKQGHFTVGYKFKNGHNIFSNGWKESENPMDYIRNIEVIFK